MEKKISQLSISELRAIVEYGPTWADVKWARKELRRRAIRQQMNDSYVPIIKNKESR